MPSRSDDRAIIDTEQRLLQSLCQETLEGSSARQTAKRLLSDYQWREPIHKIIFDCLINFPSATPLAIRDQLPSQLTRRGFPDVDWEEFFQPVSISSQEAEGLMRQLRDSDSTPMQGE